jgi:hypothetical protein
MNDHADPIADHHACAGWPNLVQYLEAFPSPTIGFDEEGEVTSGGWVFRRLPDASYRLEVAIKRAAAMRATRWAAL